MNTPRVEFTLQTITPLFLSGTEQTPELRPASVRGALRYWLRALTDAGNVSQLQESESAVFGQTDFGSPVIVRMSSSPKATDLTDRYELPGPPSGHNYLYYFTQALRNERVPYAPDESFTVSLHLSPAHSNRADLLRRACEALWCLTNLGGLGMRSHRCAGNIRVTKVAVQNSDLNLTDLFPSTFPTNLPDLQTHLATVLKSIQRKTSTTEYDVIHPANCQIWVFQENGWSNHKDVLNAIGGKMSAYRIGKGQVINSIFGLPIGKIGGRRASPLWLKVGKFSDDKHYGVATLFKSNFTKGTAYSSVLYTHIETFITSNLSKTEVIYK